MDAKDETPAPPEAEPEREPDSEPDSEPQTAEPEAAKDADLDEPARLRALMDQVRREREEAGKRREKELRRRR